MVNPFPTAPIRTSTTMPTGVASPLIHSNHRANAESIDTDCAQMRSERREYRSASDPAHGATIVVGKNAQNAANPTQAVDPVIWSST